MSKGKTSNSIEALAKYQFSVCKINLKLVIYEIAKLLTNTLEASSWNGEAQSMYHSMDASDTLDTLNVLDTLNTSDTLHTSNTLDNLDTLNTLNTLNT